MEPKTKSKTFQDLINSEKLVMVDFYAEWCGPCKMMKPILDEVKASVGTKAKIVKVDVEKNVQAASNHNVTGVPTLILFKDGKQIWRQSGVVPPGTLKQIIETNQ
jgi:thioredoxin 1